MSAPVAQQAGVASGDRAAAWSRYWATGVLHSCPRAFKGNYSDELGALWTDFFSSLTSGSRVLDLGTGNGAVAYIARDVTTQAGHAVEIEAIDAASIDPAKAAKAFGLSMAGINFRGGVRAEATGYPESWFDAVSSQYALEHTDVEATLAELARIVKPAGEALFVLHHAGSAALATTRAELEHFDFLEHTVPIVVHVRRWLKRLATATTMQQLQRLGQDAQSREQIAEIRQMAKQIGTRATTYPHAGFLNQIAAQAITAVQEAGALGPTVALGRVNTLQDEMHAHRDRLRSIARAALDADGVKRIAQSLQRAGFAPEPEKELTLRGSDVVGWVVRASRAT